MSVTIVPAVFADREQILALFQQNAYDQAKRQQDGFVRTPVTLASLNWAIERSLVVVAKEESSVIGYYLLTTDCLTDPRLDYMRPSVQSASIDGRPLTDYRIAFGAQACVAASHRRQGLGGKMFERMMDFARTQFDFLVGSITSSNSAGVNYNADCGWRLISETGDRMFVYFDLRS